MGEKSYGFKMYLGFDNIESLMDLLDLTSKKIKKDLISRKITTGYKITDIGIIDNKDFSYSIMFNLNNEYSTEEILDKAIIGE